MARKTDVFNESMLLGRAAFPRHAHARAGSPGALRPAEGVSPNREPRPGSFSRTDECWSRKTGDGVAKPVLELDGQRVHKLESFWNEVSRGLIPGADWGRNTYSGCSAPLRFHLLFAAGPLGVHALPCERCRASAKRRAARLPRSRGPRPVCPTVQLQARKPPSSPLASMPGAEAVSATDEAARKAVAPAPHGALGGVRAGPWTLSRP